MTGFSRRAGIGGNNGSIFPISFGLERFLVKEHGEMKKGVRDLVNDADLFCGFLQNLGGGGSALL